MEERPRIDREQRPPAYKELIDDLFALWKDVWVWEFASDMVATYLKAFDRTPGRERDARM